MRAPTSGGTNQTGEALRVVQRHGSRTYVSMDDAEEAAAVLNALVGVDA